MTLDADIFLRQGRFVLDGRFELPDQITALFGPSGSGKSSLLSVIAGLKRIECGRVALNGRVLDDNAARIHVPAHRRNVGVVFQDARLFPHLTVAGNIAFARRRAPAASRRAIEEVAQFFDIAPLLDRPVRHLSGGEKSRVALARALVAAPELLLLDEPFAALDGTRRRAFIRVLLDMHRTFHLPMLIVAHDIGDVAALAVGVIGLQDGRIVAAGPLAETMRTTAFRGLLDARDIGAALPAGALRGANPDAGGHAWLRADNVLLATQLPRELSARNVVESHIVALHREASGAVLVELESAAGFFLSRITTEAASELGLAPGGTVWAIVKAHLL